ncbi:hypothetical protein [Pseudoclavibacter sp. RFBA6]|uniref:hypothetical protein n=1 Tax=Pseudoclavibacter sp. RFBA6 TaxID=2080573 RepID=UPI0011B0D8A1|nr:hypothetical protein [Pseudoclavibacter sp. RFBA6]
MRVAAVDAYGSVLNEYRPGGDRRVNDDAPQRPWAVYLAGADHRYRLLAFDLDAKTPDAAANAERDALTIAATLTDAGLETVICASGPTGGRHVWTALRESVDADTIATLARLLRHLCPTLDLAPLTNPVTGCVRPPGAPHRAGGTSRILSGNTSALSSPRGTAQQIRAVIDRLAAHITPESDARPNAPHEIPVDAHQRLYLPGPRRPLPPASAAALNEDAAHGDASSTLWRVLIGAAGARWRHADVAALVDRHAGLEHLRSRRDGTTRAPRSSAAAAAILRRQWDKAVRYVANSDRRRGSDPTFDARAADVAAHVRAVQERADAAAGRWSRGGGPADRRVLDALSILALQAVNTVLEADIRRLALLAGIGRETARTSLHRLAADGWIARESLADGPHGARWTIDPQRVLHRDPGLARSQADPRPGALTTAGAALRRLLLDELTTRATAARHDVFTYGRSLGISAGNIYARLTSTPTPIAALAALTTDNADSLSLPLHSLTRYGLVRDTARGWIATEPERRDAAAASLGVTGRLDARRARYHLERELWAWWQAEQTWMTSRRTQKRRRHHPTQFALIPDAQLNRHGGHPRRPDGRADYRVARTYVRVANGEIQPPSTAPVDTVATGPLRKAFERAEKRARVIFQTSPTP